MSDLFIIIYRLYSGIYGIRIITQGVRIRTWVQNTDKYKSSMVYHYNLQAALLAVYLPSLGLSLFLHFLNVLERHVNVTIRVTLNDDWKEIVTYITYVFLHYDYTIYLTYVYIICSTYTL